MNELASLLRDPEASFEAEDDSVPVVQRPEDFTFIVLGGAGKHTAVIPTFGATRSVTLALRRRDGEYARSVEELRGT